MKSVAIFESKMKDKTKEKLIDELIELRQKIQKFESSKSQQIRREKACKESEKKSQKSHAELKQHIRELTAELLRAKKRLKKKKEEWKQAEEKMMESEEKYRSLVENANDAIYIITPEGFKFINPAFEKLTGYVSKEVCNKKFNFWDLIHAEDIKLIKKREAERKRGKEMPSRYEFRIKAKDGNIKTVEAATVDIGKKGEVKVIGILRDITERKKIEEVMQLTQFSIDRAADSVFWVGPDAKLLYVNDAACRAHGYSRRELLSMTVHDIDPDFPEEVWPEHWKEVKKRGSFAFESRHRKKDGRTFPVEISVNFLKFKGNEYNCAFVRNISERKQAEKTIQESEKKYRTLIEQSLQAIIIVQDFRIVFANKAFAKISGYTVNELLALQPEKVKSLLHSKDQALVWGRFMDRISGKSLTHHYEYRGIRKDGSVCRLEMYASRINYNGKPAVQAAILDITERKQAENALRESEEKYRDLVENLSEVIYSVDKNGMATYVSPVVKSLLEYNPSDIIGRPFAEHIYQDDLPRSIKAFQSVLQGHITTGDYRILARSGEIRWVGSSNRPIFKDSQVIGAHGVLTDITERKQAEEALIIQSKYNELRAEIWEKASDPSLTEEKGLIQNLLDTVGPAMDVSRTTYLRFIPERKAYVTELQWYKKELGSSLGEDISFDIAKHFFGQDYVEIPKDTDKIIKTPGLKRTVRFYISSKLKKHHIKSYLVVPYGNINNPKGLFTFTECEKEKEWSELEKEILSEVVNIVSLKVEQMNADRKIMASLREKEVLLQEIHHRVKNNMQIISSLLNLQSRNVKEERILETFKDTQNRVRSMALIHERFYRSKDFSKIDFAEYVQSLTSHLYHSFGMGDKIVKIKINIKDILLDINTAIPCGLIINELISNSFKHAFPGGKKGEIHISMHPLNENEIKLTVSDNGVGLPEDVDFRNTESLGLHLVTILAEDQLHGAIQLDRKRGTKFQIRLKT